MQSDKRKIKLVKRKLVILMEDFSFFITQKFSHWYWNPEFPRGPSSEFATPRGRGLRVDGLLVRENCCLKLKLS